MKCKVLSGSDWRKERDTENKISEEIVQSFQRFFFNQNHKSYGPYYF